MSKQSNASKEQDKTEHKMVTKENLDNSSSSNPNNTSSLTNLKNNKLPEENEINAFKQSEEISQTKEIQLPNEVKSDNIIMENKDDSKKSLKKENKLNLSDIKNEIIEIKKQIIDEKKQEKNKIRTSSSKGKEEIPTRFNSSKAISVLEEDIKKNKKVLDDEEISEKLINSKIEQNKNPDEILNDISLLLSKKVKIEKIVKNEYFTYKDFQILNDLKATKLNNSIYYSNPNISLNMISLLSRNIYELNIKTNSLKNDINILKCDIRKNDSEIQNLKNDKLKKDVEIKNLNDYKKESEEKIKDHEDMINSLKKQLEELSKSINSKNSNMKTNNKISNKEKDWNLINMNKAKQNYARLLNILENIDIIDKYIELCLIDLYKNDEKKVLKRIKSKYLLYDECSAEYFKISDDASYVVGIIIDNLDIKINENNIKKMEELFNYFEKKIESSKFKEIFIALKQMVFGINTEKFLDCKSIDIKMQNIDIISGIISYSFMLESQNKLKNIENLFYCAMIYFALDFYGLSDLKLLIGDKKIVIKEVMGKIINSINYKNFDINTAKFSK